MSHVDQSRVERAVREALLAAGEDPDRDKLFEALGRVARAYRELSSGLAQDPVESLSTTFSIDYEEPVLVYDIELMSCCEHHLLPFFEAAYVGYIPSGGRMTGLSKLIRLVDIYTRRPQVQERLITQVVDVSVTHLSTQGVTAVIEAEYTYMTIRGVRRPSSRTIISVVQGRLRNATTYAGAMNPTMTR